MEIHLPSSLLCAAGKRCNVCKRDFDFTSIGTHCRRCGQLYCPRCIPKKLSLRGHDSHAPVPVCLICVKSLVILGEPVNSCSDPTGLTDDT